MLTRRSAKRQDDLWDQIPTGIGPAGVEVFPRALVVDGSHAATLMVTGYPAEVLPGWIDALTAYPAQLDVALHADPVPARIAAEKLRRRRTRLEAGRRESAGRGRLVDPALESAADTAAQLAHSLARAETKLFTAALYVTAYAGTRDELDVLLADVTALLASFLATAQIPTFRMLHALQSTMPGADDRIKQVRILDATALTACAPLLSPDPPQDANAAASPTAVLAGMSAATGTPVFRDRWRETNHNSLILGSSGAGKSFLAKTDLLRELCNGTVCSVIDPEGEYAPIAEAVGGRVLQLGLPGARLNILDLPAPQSAGPCEIAARVLDLHALAAVLLGAERAERLRPQLDRAALGAYRQAGITQDPATWDRVAPDLGDVAAEARETLDSSSVELAELLQPYTHGSFSSLFVRAADGNAEPSRHSPQPLTVYTLEHLPEVMRTPAMLLVLSTIWRTAQAADSRRMLLIDEAWQLLQDRAAAQFVYRIAKSARKHRLGLSLVTQDASDLLRTELGTAVACNAATQIVLRQAPQALGAVTEAFRCSAGERDFLQAAPRGYALVRTGTSRTAITAIATPAEAPLLHTGL